nr:RecName: Full=Periplasmic [NiFeSe] hydrogenase large subunit; AltName: Full=NiFeSe hydrogenlyase large chain [Desulfomicrobium norvegicum]
AQAATPAADGKKKISIDTR